MVLLIRACQIALTAVALLAGLVLRWSAPQPAVSPPTLPRT